MTGSVRVDERGLVLPAEHEDSCDVLFDGQHVWSFAPAERPLAETGERFVPWPRVMRSWLDGTALVTVTSRGRELFAEELRFGVGTDRIRFVDRDGIPVMIDKWGLLQRPFAGRGRGVVAQMVEMSERIIAILDQECGVQAWIAFGTLLGAAREGKVIGHDSDIDLAYLSRQSTPAAMAVEMFEISRALRRAGLHVMNKSASFITVLFEGPDGGKSSIDLYTCFYVGDLLYETATVRAPVPRSAIEPLTTLRFEGRMLPAPADPDVMLTASYGPRWRVPDPSFAHRPGADIKLRFDPWFGSLMRHRRDWERHFRATAVDDPDRRPSDFAHWVRRRIPRRVPLLDVGTGDGRDALMFATRGWPVVGLDYARGAFTRSARRAARRGVPATFEPLNLYDLRDVVTRAALLSRSTPGPRVLYARSVLDALEPDGRDNLWRFADMVLRGRGSAFVEFGTSVHHPGTTSEKRARLDPADVERAVVGAGGRVAEVERVAAEAGRPLWRMAVEWTR